MPTASRWSERYSLTCREPTRTSLSTSCTLCESGIKSPKSTFSLIQGCWDGKTWCKVCGPTVKYILKHLIQWCLIHRYSRGVMSPGRHVRTRLYFTSESHVHSLLSIFRYGGLLDVSNQISVLQNIECCSDWGKRGLSLFAAGGEGPAVEACHGLPQCRLWTQLHDSDCHHVVWGQQ